MASFLTTLFVICAIVLFALFFVIFKLIWLLCKHKRNFWPLILSGCCTALLLLVSAVVVYQSYKRFAGPIQPIITAATSKQPPQYGVQTFTDPQQNFSLTTHDGIVMSNWIKFSPENQFLIGLDVNPFRLDKEQTKQLSGLFITRQKQMDFTSAQQFFQNLFFPALEHNKTAQQSVEVTQGPISISAGPDSSAAYVRGLIHSDKTPTPLPAVFLVAVHGQDTYYIVGVGSQSADDTVTSFRFLN